MPGSGIVGKEMKYKLTEEQNALAGRIRQDPAHENHVH